MATKIADARVEITANTADFDKKLARSSSRLSKFGAGLARVGKRAAFAFGATLAAGSAFAVKAAVEQENAEKRLEAVLKATGNAAGFTAQQLKDQASELQQLTSIGDETILGTQTIIATFKNIKGDQFKATTLAALDLADVMGTDAKQAAIQLGKALNDPAVGLTLLNRSGISFTETQKEQIKLLVKTGQLQKAQAIILKEVSAQFGGAAEAAGKTFGGQLKLLAANVGDVFEEFGFFITQNEAVRDILTKTAKRAADFAKRLKEVGAVKFNELLLSVQLFTNEFKTNFLKIFASAKFVFKAIREQFTFLGEALGVIAFNFVTGIQNKFENLKKNVIAIFESIKNKAKNPFEEFTIDLISLTDGLEERLVKFPEKPTEAFKELVAELDRLTQESGRKQEQISNQFAEAAAKATERGAEREAKAVKQSEMVKRVERKKTAGTFISVADAIKRAQAAVFTKTLAVAGAPGAAAAPGAVMRGDPRAPAQRDKLIHEMQKVREETSKISAFKQ